MAAGTTRPRSSATVVEVPAPLHLPPTTVADAVSQLSAEHRAVLSRSYYLGWTVARIAEDLNIAEGTVKARLHYAMRALLRSLQHCGELDGG